MKIDSKLLSTALHRLRSVVSTRTLIPIMGCALIRAEHGMLSITATDGDQMQMETINCDGDLEPICLNLHHLSASISGDETQITLSNNMAAIKPSGIKLNTLPAKEFPSVPEQKNQNAIGINCEDLAAGIEAVEYCASDDKTRTAIQCVHVIGSAKQILCEAIDGRQAAFCEKLSMSCDCEFTIPRDFCKNFKSALLVENATVFTSENWLRVENDSGFYICKRQEEQFPKTMKDVREYQKRVIGEIELLPLVSILETSLAAFVDPASYPFADLEFSDAGLLITNKSQTSELNRRLYGKFEPLKCRVDMRRLLKAASRMGIKTEFLADAEKPENHISLKSGDTTALIMTMRSAV